MNSYLIHIFDIRRRNMLFIKVLYNYSQCFLSRASQFIFLLFLLLVINNFFLNNLFFRKSNKF